MFPALVLALALNVAAGPDQRPKLVVKDVVPGAGVDAELARSVTTSLAAELSRRGVYDVVTHQDISTMVGAERQRELLGCSEDSTTCLTEISGALGAQFVVSGSMVRLGSAWQLTLNTVDSRAGRAVGRAVRVAMDAAGLVEGWPYTVAEAAGLPPPRQPSKVVPILVVGAGAAAAIGGALVLLQSFYGERELETELRLAERNPAILRPAAAYEAEAASLRNQRQLGGGLLGAGVVAAAVGAVWLSRTQEAGPVLMAWVPSRNGIGVAFVGGLP